MVDKPSRPQQPAFMQEHDGDIFVFMTDEGALPQGALSIGTLNGDVLIFSNCSGDLIQDLQRRINGSRTERPLSGQQLRCLRAAMQGKPAKQIAKEMRLSARTVDGHLARCRDRLGAATTLGAAVLARQAGISLDTPAEPCPLTARQLQCLRSIARGDGAAAVAAELGLSINGVNFHLSAARQRLGTTTTRAAVAIAIRAGWLASTS